LSPPDKGLAKVVGTATVGEESGGHEGGWLSASFFARDELVELVVGKRLVGKTKKEDHETKE